MEFIGYSKCTTCQKAKKWLDSNGAEYTERPIKEQNPSVEELKTWHRMSGLPLKKFFNTSGLLYKDMKLKDRLPSMSEEEQYALLATDGMLVKRPMVIGDDFVLVGFREAEWEEKIKDERSSFMKAVDMISVFSTATEEHSTPVRNTENIFLNMASIKA